MSQLPDYIKPFIKWVGGKTQIINTVLNLFPKKINNYHEPFLGGGSILLALLTQIANKQITIIGKIYASDVNANLIGLYKNIQNNPEELIIKVQHIQTIFTACKGDIINRMPKTIEEALTSPESYYFWMRAKFNKFTQAERTSVYGSAVLLFLNKTCFRGLYREGPNGFNVPFGNYKNPNILEPDHIRTVSTLIKDVIFTCQDFTESLKKVQANDFIYLDPPYAPENETSFVAYNKGGFDLECHKKLFESTKLLITKNAKMLMSNADVKLVNEAFPTPIYTTKIISCRRAINSKEPESRTNEVLITN